MCKNTYTGRHQWSSATAQPACRNSAGLFSLADLMYGWASTQPRCSSPLMGHRALVVEAAETERDAYTEQLAVILIVGTQLNHVLAAYTPHSHIYSVGEGEQVSVSSGESVQSDGGSPCVLLLALTGVGRAAVADSAQSGLGSGERRSGGERRVCLSVCFLASLGSRT